MNPLFLFVLFLVLLSGCAKEPAPEPVRLVTVHKSVAPVVPRECKAANPPSPVITGGTAGEVEDHVSDQSETIDTLKNMRDVCRAALAKQSAASKD